MKALSKRRPSHSTRRTALTTSSAPATSVRMPQRLPRVYRNSYTRGGRRFSTSGWVVKLQHAGRRRTFSLRATNKAGAATEAQAICDTLRTEGWEAVQRLHTHTTKAAHFSKMDPAHWREQLMARRYRFPGADGGEQDLAARIDHAGTGYWFPLGTADAEAAAARALAIYKTVVQHGWDECLRRFPRELIVGFEWCSNPLLWTYATIHTLLDRETPPSLPRTAGPTPFRRVLLVETDAGIRRALEWCINQHPGFAAVACESPDLFASLLESRRPHLVLLNRNLAERLKLSSPGQVAPLRSNIAALTYSVAVDGDQLFVSTPGGAEGYFIKRVRPDRVLEPVLEGGPAELAGGDLLPRIKTYFKQLLQPRAGVGNAGLGRLTRRENEVLALLSKGCVDKEIAQTLGISAWTVHGHIKSIFDRLQVRTRTEAVVRYLEK